MDKKLRRKTYEKTIKQKRRIGIGCIIVCIPANRGNIENRFFTLDGQSGIQPQL